MLEYEIERGSSCPWKAHAQLRVTKMERDDQQTNKSMI